jgi:uncharacterized membrane protein
MKKDIKYFLKEYFLHLLVILVSGAIYLGGCFQNSLWFDDAYTVGLMNQNFLGVIKWATFDVHPHLYYVMLKLFTLVFGNTLPVMRIFSVIGAVLSFRSDSLTSEKISERRSDFGLASSPRSALRP